MTAKRKRDCSDAPGLKQRKKSVRFEEHSPTRSSTRRRTGTADKSSLREDRPASPVTDDKDLRWYSRQDYRDFLEARLHTIRLYRCLGGNESLLEPHYSLRGLEMYKTNSIHSEIHCHRLMHHQAVLREQARQKVHGIYDPALIGQQVSHISDWALQKAQRQADMDAVAAGSRSLLLGLESSIPFPRRSSLSTTDLARLRVMNAELIQSHLKANATFPTDTSLFGLMSSARRFSATGSILSPRSSDPKTSGGLSSTGGVDSSMSPLCFTPFRRDSLHGLS